MATPAQLARFKEQWRALPAPSASMERLTGSFSGHMHFFAGSGALKALVNCLWQGTDFSGSTATTLVAWIVRKTPPETGTVSYVEQSTIDGKPCIRIDFADRFYQGRWLDDDRLLDIVTFKKPNAFPNEDNVSDVHILTRRKRYEKAL